MLRCVKVFKAMKQSANFSFPALSGIFMVIVPLFSSSLIAVWVVQNEKMLSQFGTVEWLGVSVVCCFTSMIALTPPTFLALIFGYFLGWNALLPLFALNLGAIFWVNKLARMFDKAQMVHFLNQNPKAKALLEKIHGDELRLVFFTKISPVLPFALTNLIFALAGVQLKNVLIGGFFGMIPRTVLAVWVGSQAQEILKLIENPNEGLLPKIILLVLVVVSVFGILRIFKPK